MMWFWAGYSISYLAALLYLFWVVQNSRKKYPFAKGLCSALFLVAALVSYFCGAQNNTLSFVLLFAALLFCAMGDVFLGIANRQKKVRARPFLAGTIVFSAAHMLFCVLFLRARPPAWYILLPPLLCLACIRIFEARGMVRLKSMRVFAYIYAFLVAMMLAASFGFWPQASLFSPLGLLSAAGGFLFFISDFILLFLYFGTKRNRSLRYFNLFTYYGGIYLLALSSYWW